MPKFDAITPHVKQLGLRWLGAIINVWLAQDALSRTWTLIDCGPPDCGASLAEAVEDAIGAAPAAIIITHGHIDHVGGLQFLLDRWAVPVWAHPEEIPFLTGARHYRDVPSTDLIYRLLSRVVPALHFSGTAFHPVVEPSLFGLEVHHVPGHSPGMIALLHPLDAVCIAADTFRFKPGGCMPLFTYDRDLARDSMRRVSALESDYLLTTHSGAMTSAQFRSLRTVLELGR